MNRKQFGENPTASLPMTEPNRREVVQAHLSRVNAQCIASVEILSTAALVYKQEAQLPQTDHAMFHNIWEVT